MELVALTRQLVDIPSITGAEQTVGRFLAAFLMESGFQVEAQEVAPGRANLLAWTRSPNGTYPDIFFSTHMDTVPPFIPSSEDAGFIYGRGSCDAKGIIASQICAAMRLRHEQDFRVGLLFTVDEECSGIGARAANAHPMASRCRYLINGEPTDNLLAIGSKGSIRLSIEAAGRAAHSAYPEQGESAIEKLLAVLASIQAIPWPADGFFGATTCNIGLISGGTATNVVPERARAELHIRLVTPSEIIRTLVEQAVGGRAEVRYLSTAEPIRLTQVSGFDSCVVRFTTDIPHLRRWGAPLLVGPGSILVAHTGEERVAKSQLQAAVDNYIRLAQALRRSHPPAAPG